MASQDFAGIGMTSLRTRRRLIKRLEKEGICHPRVLDAILQTPRHLFVDEAIAHRAYEDVALPIGFGQTISQPFIVARMTALLLEGGIPKKVLEIGTGSGYQAAILSRLAETVFTVERIRDLFQKTQHLLRELKYKNITCAYSDGYQGWPEQSPFDGIIATAVANHIPPILLDELADGGCLVMPVGTDEEQKLIRVVRHGNEYQKEEFEPVRFVPFLGGKA